MEWDNVEIITEHLNNYWEMWMKRKKWNRWEMKKKGLVSDYGSIYIDNEEN